MLSWYPFQRGPTRATDPESINMFYSGHSFTQALGIQPHVKSLRSSYTGLYHQMGIVEPSRIGERVPAPEAGRSGSGTAAATPAGRLCRATATSIHHSARDLTVMVKFKHH